MIEYRDAAIARFNPGAVLPAWLPPVKGAGGGAFDRAGEALTAGGGLAPTPC